MTTHEILRRAAEQKKNIAKITSQQKNDALFAMAKRLVEHTSDIIAENKLDLESARGNISDVMLDRLMLNESRIKAMSDGMKEVAALKDPVGRILSSVKRDNGLVIEKVSVPMGVVAIIYESRPNVTSDAAALAFKSGNVCVLRGGKEAYRTSRAITNALREGLDDCKIPRDFIQLVEDTTRVSANELMTAAGYVDLLIPRGGAGLINACLKNATVPCIQTGTGICHIYVDDTADFDMALNIIENAKASRPSVCNACEVCLINEKIAPEFLPLLKKRLCNERAQKNLVPVELRLCEKSAAIINGTKAGEDDFDTEFLDYILAVRVVADVNEAVEHILKHSTGHSEAIITNTARNAELFLNGTDSAAVYLNASTRFTDGGEFGLGCEMGISTQKLHARGPMGLCELNTYKYIVRGNGQIR